MFFKRREIKQIFHSAFGAPSGWKPEEIIAFVRCSDEQQADGTTEARQVHRALAVCELLGWPKPRFVKALGVSAWKRDKKSGMTRFHSEKSEFGRLLASLRAGKRYNNLLVIFENADRFSRAKLDEADNALMDLLRCGVYVYIVSLGMLLRPATDDYPGDQNDPYKRGLMQQLFARSNEESDRKSDLIKASYDERLEHVIVHKEKVNWGGLMVRWVVWDEEKQDYVPGAHFATLVRIVRDVRAKIGLNDLARTLSTEKVPTLSGKGTWSSTLIRQILGNKALMGTWKILGYELPDYIPPVCTEEVWQEIQAMYSGLRRPGGGSPKTQVLNLFPSRVYCSHCGANMQIWMGSDARKFFNRTLRCRGYIQQFSRKTKTTCTHTHRVYVELLEMDFFSLLLKRNPYHLFVHEGDKDRQNQIFELRQQLDENEIKLERAREEFINKGDEGFREHYYKLKGKKEDLAKRLAHLYQLNHLDSSLDTGMSYVLQILKEAGLTEETVSGVFDWAEQLLLQLRDQAFRRKVIEPLKLLINKVEIYSEPDKICYKVEFVTGGWSDWQDITKLHTDRIAHNRKRSLSALNRMRKNAIEQMTRLRADPAKFAEFRKKMSEAHKGIHPSPETIAKRSASIKAVNARKRQEENVRRAAQGLPPLPDNIKARRRLMQQEWRAKNPERVKTYNLKKTGK